MCAKLSTSCFCKVPNSDNSLALHSCTLSEHQAHATMCIKRLHTTQATHGYLNTQEGYSSSHSLNNLTD